MNLNVMQVNGGLLLVPQFTLVANTTKGLRPSFNGADPAAANRLFDSLSTRIESDYKSPETGVFGADMQVSSCNDGPVSHIVIPGLIPMVVFRDGARIAGSTYLLRFTLNFVYWRSFLTDVA